MRQKESQRNVISIEFFLGKRCLRDLGGITSSSGHLKTPIKSSKYFLTSSASSSSRILQKTKLLANKKIKKKEVFPPKSLIFLEDMREKHDEQSESSWL